MAAPRAPTAWPAILRVVPKPIQIQGKDYYVNLAVTRGSTASGEVNIVLELYDAAEEPVFTNDIASVEPVETIHCYGDAGTLYYQFHKALEVLNATRSW
jgi:hypothetical protein